MNQSEQQPQSSGVVTDPDKHPIHNRVILVMLILMTVEWVLILLDQRWLSLFLVTFIILTLLAPVIFRNRMEMEIPAEFHILAVIFTFASLYLGEIQSFYQRLWWWDIALHATAGLLMGILGFLLVYILNESRRVELQMNAGFIAFFAFLFAVSIGSLWEIFEFGMDQIFGMNMQKAMFGDPSGLTDTMWDVTVNAFGALVISLAGWRYLKSDRGFFVNRWIHKFIHRNPTMFRK